jgi:molecular chaperone GrpE
VTKNKSDGHKFQHKKPSTPIPDEIPDFFESVNDSESGISSEPTEPTEPTEESINQNTIETLKQQLEILKQKADKNWELAVRAKAELDNVRKRAETEVSNAHKFALDRFIPELFPLLDGLEQGLQALAQDASFESVRMGLNLSIKMFNDMLVKFGVEIVDPVHQSFDPAVHEAIAMQPSDPANPVANGTVLVVVQKGYVLHKRVLRPARVIVAKNMNS